jgi:hypothetical protein
LQDDSSGTIHYIQPPETLNHVALDLIKKIVRNVEFELHDARLSGIPEILSIHPRVLISMTVTNIIINLLLGAVHHQNSVQTRFKMMEDLLREINFLTLESWKALETNKADLNNSH